jgi:hypothetical protein
MVPRPTRTVLDLKAGQSVKLQTFHFGFPILLVSQRDGIERFARFGVRNYGGTRLSGPATVRLIDFVPAIAGARRTDAPSHHDEVRREIGVEVLDGDRGNYLLVEGLERFATVSFSVFGPRRETDPVVAMNCGGQSWILPANERFESPRQCAFALIGAENPPVVTLNVSGRLTALSAPKLPSLEDGFGWRPFEPKPKKLTDEKAQQLQSLFNDARLNASKREYGDAAMNLSYCVKLYPFSADCHLLYGFVLSQQGMGTSAIREYREFLKLMPDHPSAESVRAILKSEAP